MITDKFKPGFHGHLFFDEDYLSQKFWQRVCVDTQQRLLIVHSSLTLAADVNLTMILRHRIEFTRAYFSSTKLLCQRKLVRGNQALLSIDFKLFWGLLIS